MTNPVTLVTQSLSDLSHNNGKSAQMFRTGNLTIEIHVVTMARRGYRRNQLTWICLSNTTAIFTGQGATTQTGLLLFCGDVKRFFGKPNVLKELDTIFFMFMFYLFD